MDLIRGGVTEVMVPAQNEWQVALQEDKRNVREA